MTDKVGFLIYTILGVIFGVTVDHYIHVGDFEPFYPVFICLFCFLYGLAYDEHNSIRLIGTSLLVALFLALPLFDVLINHSFSGDKEIHLLYFALAYPTFIYIAHAFHYAYHKDNSCCLNYSSLFEGVWNTLPLLFVACVFGTLANLLVMLAAVVFKTVGSNFIWDLYFSNKHFYCISNALYLFIGIGIGKQNVKIIYNLRFLLLKMMHYLFPVLAGISVLYCVLYTINALTGGVTPIDPLAVLVPLSGLGIVFFNAYFQDGETDTGFPAGLNLFIRIYRVALLLLTVIMVGKILNRYTVEINPFICLLTTFFFALTYGVTALFAADQEKRWIKKGNIATALFFIVALFLVNLPYLQIKFNVTQNSGSMFW